MKETGMIDVGLKAKTKRIAIARSYVQLNNEIVDKIRNNQMPKGNILETAKIAGIMAAKKTAELIPLCHNIEIEHVGLEFELHDSGVLIKAEARTTAKTGIEMEVMTACSIAALTIYDMCKMFSHSIKIENIELLEKRGGKSGTYKK